MRDDVGMKVEEGADIDIDESGEMRLNDAFACMAARWAPRAWNVTMWPRRESCTPRRPPIAPAPMTHIRAGTSASEGADISELLRWRKKVPLEREMCGWGAKKISYKVLSGLLDRATEREK